MKDKKKKNEVTDVTPEPVFNIHRMPKNYKSGRFEISSNDGETKVQPTQKHRQKNKKIGLLIIVFASFFVLFLGYLVFSYISNPNFSFNNIFNLKNNSEIASDNKIDNSLEDSKDKEKENVGQNEALIEEDNLEENIQDEELIDNLEENTQDEELIEDAQDENLEEIISYAFVDTDGDGLSDKEEILLGSNYLKLDSDDDGHDDLTEILNLYDPIGPGKLIDNDNISEFESKIFNYSIWYPVSWDKSALSDDSSLVFLINDNSFIQVLVEKNEKQQNIRDWYSSRFFNFIDKDKIIIKDNYQGLYSEDNLVFYLTDKDFKNVYTILYSFPNNQTASYLNIFNMMVNSFKLK